VRPFGVDIWAYDPFLDPTEIQQQNVRAVSFDRLIEAADYLVIQAPLTPETRHLFNRVTLRRMKPTAILINTARGPIVAWAAEHRTGRLRNRQHDRPGDATRGIVADDAPASPVRDPHEPFAVDGGAVGNAVRGVGFEPARPLSEGAASLIVLEPLLDDAA
jgi:hypothetical protein